MQNNYVYKDITHREIMLEATIYKWYNSIFLP